MAKTIERREFLKRTAWMGAVALAAGRSVAASNTPPPLS